MSSAQSILSADQRLALVLAFALAIGLDANAPAFAWGADGHRIVGAAAEAALTGEARAWVREALGTESLAEAALWADTIRGEQPGTRPWHYVNIPPGEDDYDRERDCPDGDCVVERVREEMAALRNPRHDGAAAAESLRFLVHFVGDVFQPLHVGYAEDRGGNRIEGRFDGHRVNLHALWDTALVERLLASKETSWTDYAAALGREVRDAREREDVSTDAAPEDWVHRSRTRLGEVYRNEPDGTVIDGFDLGDSYFLARQPLLEACLRDGAAALASAINAIARARLRESAAP